MKTNSTPTADDVQHDDDTVTPGDPLEAWDEFGRAMARYTKIPKARTEARDSAWSHVCTAYQRVRLTFTPDDLRGYWAKIKQLREDHAPIEGHRLEPLALFGRERTRRSKMTKRYRSNQARYDADRAQTHERQEQIRRARATHKKREREKLRNLKQDVAEVDDAQS